MEIGLASVYGTGGGIAGDWLASGHHGLTAHRQRGVGDPRGDVSGFDRSGTPVPVITQLFRDPRRNSPVNCRGSDVATAFVTEVMMSAASRRSAAMGTSLVDPSRVEAAPQRYYVAS